MSALLFTISSLVGYDLQLTTIVPFPYDCLTIDLTMMANVMRSASHKIYCLLFMNQLYVSIWILDCELKSVRMGHS